jgi:hypothetical protein
MWCRRGDPLLVSPCTSQIVKRNLWDLRHMNFALKDAHKRTNILMQARCSPPVDDLKIVHQAHSSLSRSTVSLPKSNNMSSAPCLAVYHDGHKCLDCDRKFFLMPLNGVSDKMRIEACR